MQNKTLDKPSALIEFLELDGVQELKSKLIDMIVEEVRTQLHESSSYIISPDDIAQDLYDEIVPEIKEEVKEKYKAKIMENLEKRLDLNV